MLRQFLVSLRTLLLVTVVAGVIYPLAVTGIALAVFPHQAHGSLVTADGRVVGSALVGQRFIGAQYFQGRPSAAGSGYDADASGASNLGPTSRKLYEQVLARVAAARASDGLVTQAPVPVDLVTASASGVDPDITPASARVQAARVARARGMSLAEVRGLIRANTSHRQLAVLGEDRVNVLSLNLALDERAGVR